MGLGDRRVGPSRQSGPDPDSLGATAPISASLGNPAGRSPVGARARSAPGKPAVLFVDGGVLAPFIQLAVALRRWGYRTIRVTTSRRTLGARLTRRLAFDRVLHIDPAELASLDRVLADERLVDVHCAETLAPDAYGVLERLPCATKAGWLHRADLVDKTTMIHLLDAASIAHPRWLVGSTGPDEAAAALGWPIVVKPRVGANGQG
ncbi:MAG: hypothetical protein ACRDVW_11295, partial [Acidimicrobiales bacterium]